MAAAGARDRLISGPLEELAAPSAGLTNDPLPEFDALFLLIPAGVGHCDPEIPA
jgi:hypothetical protein